ncbi:hypothetical protein, partial [Streptomyces sp. NPDC003374]
RASLLGELRDGRPLTRAYAEIAVTPLRGTASLRELVGEGFANQQHSAAFLWWAKDQPGAPG